MRSKTRRILSLVMAALMLCGSAVTAWAEESSVTSAQAAAMQLMRTEGTVAVTNNSGRALSARDNMNLYNGYHVSTQAASYAWISLDSEKLTKLDQVSDAELRKSGKVLELLLNSGNLFFNVTSPLEEDETLNIRTSTMVLGIRGTSGWVRVEDRWKAEIFVLEGAVECSVADPVTGQVKSATIQSGQKATAVVYPQDQAGDKCDILMDQYQIDDIDGFALVELAADPALCEKILNASGMDILAAIDEQAAQQRLLQDQQTMRGLLDDIEGRLAAQERNVSTDHVWGRHEDTPQPEVPAPDLPEQPEKAEETEETERPRNAGDYSSGSDSSSSGSGGGSSGGNSSNNNTQKTKTLPMPVTAQQVQDALNTGGVEKVVVTSSSHTQLVVDIEKLEVPSGKTLTMGDDVSVKVNSGSALTVRGTMTGGFLSNDGTVGVFGSNTLEMNEIFNTGGFVNTPSGRTKATVITNQGYMQNDGDMEASIKVESSGVDARDLASDETVDSEGTTGSLGYSRAHFTMNGGTLKAPSGQRALTVSSNTSLYLYDGTVSGEVLVDFDGVFYMNGGTIDGGSKTALVLKPGSVLKMEEGEGIISSSSPDNTISISTNESATVDIEFITGTVINKGTGVAVSIDSQNEAFGVYFNGTTFQAKTSDMISVMFYGDPTHLNLREYGYTYREDNEFCYWEKNGQTQGPSATPGESTLITADGEAIIDALRTMKGGSLISLEDDVEITVSNNITVSNGDEEIPIILDLNTHTLSITMENGASFTVSGGGLEIVGDGGTGGRLELNSPINVAGGATVKVRSGTIVAGTDNADTVGDFHPVVEIRDNSQLVMYNGILTGHGDFPAIRVTRNSMFNLSGGNVYSKVFVQDESTLFMMDGFLDATEFIMEIDGSSELYMIGGTIEGNVSLRSSSTLTMYEDATIISDAKRGSTISTDGTVRLELYGGEITNSISDEMNVCYVVDCSANTLPPIVIDDISKILIRAKQPQLFAAVIDGFLTPTDLPGYSVSELDEGGYYRLITAR